MDISVLVVCYNEEAFIDECLKSLRAQDFTLGALDILVVDGGSSDATRDIVCQHAAEDPRVRLTVDPRPGTAAGRNTAVAEASYDMIAFIDGDCIAPPDWITILAGEFTQAEKNIPKLAAVGGSNLPPENATAFIQAIAIAQDSFLGSFNSAQGRQFTEQRQVSSLANLNVLYDRKAVLEVGGYDETLISDAEDADLNFRLSQAGWTFLFCPSSHVWHYMRATPRSFLKNMFKYGRGRARLLKRHPKLRSSVYLLPLFFLLAMVALPLGLFWPIFLLPLLYIPGILLLSWQQVRKHRRPDQLWRVTMVYAMQHFGYAAGEFRGLVSKRIR